MRILNLIENTEGKAGCAFAHGLSFYIETGKHRLLVDLGPSEETISNAGKLGVDLSAIDTVILSHGHYDHSGGIMPFAQKNATATIYMQRTATGDYYSQRSDGTATNSTSTNSGNSAGTNHPLGDDFRYIGIDKAIAVLPQVKFVDGDYKIDDELSLFVIDHKIQPVPFTNKRLKVRHGDAYDQDDFCHEQMLVLTCEGRTVLLSGCAHNGIVNILAEYSRKFGSAPDAVISGFHLVKKTDYTDEELREIEATARELTTYPTHFYTCHCTGTAAFEVMKEIMGDQLTYVHTGDEIVV